MQKLVTLQFKYKKGKKNFCFRHRRFNLIFFNSFPKVLYKSLKTFDIKQSGPLISNFLLIPKSSIPLNILYNKASSYLDCSLLGNKLQTSLISVEKVSYKLDSEEALLNPLLTATQTKEEINYPQQKSFKFDKLLSKIDRRILLLQNTIEQIKQRRFSFKDIFKSIMIKHSNVATIFLTFFKTKNFIENTKPILLLLFYFSSLEKKQFFFIKNLLKSKPNKRLLRLKLYNTLLLKRHKIKLNYKNILSSILSLFNNINLRLSITKKSLVRIVKKKNKLQEFSNKKNKLKKPMFCRLDSLPYNGLNYNTKINFNQLFLNYILYTKSRLIQSTPINDLPAIQKRNNRFRNLQKFFQPLNILFSFVKNKYFLVNLINPLLNINLFSGHPSLTRNKIFNIARHNFKKYAFLLHMKKKKALKNPFMRTLTILSASLYLYKLLENTPYSISLLLNIPRHLINKTLLFGLFSFFIIKKKKKTYLNKKKTLGSIRQWWKYRSFGFKLVFKYPSIICTTMANTRMPFFLLFLSFILKHLRLLLLREIYNSAIFPLSQRILNTRNTIKFILIYRLSFFFSKRSPLIEINKNNNIYSLIRKFYARPFFFKNPRNLNFFKAQRNFNIHSILFNFTQSHCGLTKIRKNKR